MTLAATVLQRDDAVYVDVDITPLPTVLPSAPAGVTPSPSGVPDHGWLAATGFEPAWLMAAGAVVAVAVGVALLHRHRRRA
ncbi:LPXTG cell wall anchor domain-containing protein [uncultured Microbacterium sp.]|uniref:LPXTG cell wall anchor domain-containing protein n=1 Tax=uncultured Microbacterium sp. TaxID=191216 RepID=UPI0028D73CED|nr:LPXTG cell wall anchor domain-containing protein [uncultured Microbacterium sp.]